MFPAVDGVKIAHVDCTAGDNVNKELCNSNGVNGFPTLNIYKDGVKVTNSLIDLTSTNTECRLRSTMARGIWPNSRSLWRSN